MRSYYAFVGPCAILLLLATNAATSADGAKRPIVAVVIEADGFLPPKGVVATYLVRVTEKHPDFAKGEQVEIHLTAKAKVQRGKGAKPAPPTGWGKGTKILIDRFDGIQKSRPPQIYPELIVIVEAVEPDRKSKD